MSKPTQLDLKIKLDRHKDFMLIYQRQMKELTAKMTERAASISRLQDAIEKIVMDEQTAFNRRLYRAKDDSAACPLTVGQRYRYSTRHFEVVVRDQANGVYGVKEEGTDRFVVTGKDLGMIGETFYFDFPGAELC